MVMADFDDITALLSAPDPVRVDRPARTRDDAVRWMEWRARNYPEHGFGLHGVEHLVALVRPENTPSQGVARKLGMEVERTAVVHGGDALVFGMRMGPGAQDPL